MENDEFAERKKAKKKERKKLEQEDEIKYSLEFHFYVWRLHYHQPIKNPSQ